MQLCNQRVEQITYYQKGNLRLLPVKMGLRSGEKLDEKDLQNSNNNNNNSGFFDFLSSKLNSILQISDNDREEQSVVGVMLNERPDCDGEWITKVKFQSTKVMSDPLNPSSRYTVYIIEVFTKVMEKGKLVANNDWKVIRRYRQINSLKAKVYYLYHHAHYHHHHHHHHYYYYHHYYYHHYYYYHHHHHQ
jgi:hypothetical protein